MDQTLLHALADARSVGEHGDPRQRLSIRDRRERDGVPRDLMNVRLGAAGCEQGDGEREGGLRSHGTFDRRMSAILGYSAISG